MHVSFFRTKSVIFVLKFRTEINKSVLNFRTLYPKVSRISTYSNPIERKCNIGARPVIQ